VNDYGAIFVSRAAGSQPKPGFGYSLKFGTDEDVKGRVHVTGYKGREKKAGAAVPAGTTSDLGELVESSGKYAGDGSQLLYEADTEQGMSGSPVWVEHNGYPTVVGIQLVRVFFFYIFCL
jgi:V8-like Glu-specific endopeptidase